ncbi:MAG TPA: hypothetical protein VJ846_10330 [Sphingomicrobium sp.]|nr:hypothetical protein [Sphingomicrobium sp.]
MNEEPEWFAPKRYGIGSGLPISWQGWAITGAFVVLAGLASLLIRHSWLGYISVLAMLVLTFALICARTTRGGWRWRWGDED